MVRIGLAAEADADARVARGLGDRVIQHGRDWIPDETIDDQRRWVGLDGTDWLRLAGAWRQARERGLSPHGKFGAEVEDARMHLAVLRLFADLGEGERPGVVLIQRDLDQRGEERRAGANRAAEAAEWPFQVVFGLADPKLEAWLLAAWVPATEDDRRRLAESLTELGFDPTREPERLRASTSGEKLDAKRVLAALDPERTAEGQLLSRSVDELRTLGEKSGLALFVRALAETAARCFGRAKL